MFSSTKTLIAAALLTPVLILVGASLAARLLWRHWHRPTQ
jgi:hypothetical protein